jgi:hypothetical protein
VNRAERDRVVDYLLSCAALSCSGDRVEILHSLLDSVVKLAEGSVGPESVLTTAVDALTSARQTIVDDQLTTH